MGCSAGLAWPRYGALHQGLLLSLAQANWSLLPPAAAFKWETKSGCGSLPQTVGAEAGRWTKPLPPSPPCACSVLPAGSPCSNTMVDGIKVTFLAVTVADNLSHEFYMLWMEYSKKVLIIWHRLIPTHHLVFLGVFFFVLFWVHERDSECLLLLQHLSVYFHNDVVGHLCGFTVYI